MRISFIGLRPSQVVGEVIGANILSCRQAPLHHTTRLRTSACVRLRPLDVLGALLGLGGVLNV